MKRFFQKHSIVLAALLQFFPLVRQAVMNPAGQSAFAIIFRWAAGATIALESVDAVSGASVAFDCPTPVPATVGVPFVYYATLGGNIGGDAGATVTAAPLPGGLTCTTYEKLSGGTNAVWGVIAGTPTTVGTNSILLTGSHPSASSVTKFITIYVYGSSTPLSLTSQPASVAATNLQTVTMSAGATGTGPYIYQWYHGSTNMVHHISGATNTSYIFKAITNATTPNILASNTAGIYLCKVTGASGMLITTNAILTLSAPAGSAPVITSQPVGVTNVAGNPCSFSVGATGSAPLSYLWRLGGAAVSGATNSAYAIANAHARDAGDYTVVVTNSSGAITSTVATLGVTLPASPTLSPSPAGVGNQFSFAFTPAVGLTNTVETNSSPLAGQWAAFTNIPPPPTATILSITDSVDSVTRFYRVVIVP